MGRKKAGEAKNINRINEARKQSGASTRLISLWTDVKYSTASSWNSNTSQPNEENLDQIGELLEEDNRMLIAPQGREKTGLTQALEAELNRLHKVEGIPYQIKQFDEKKKKPVMVNNPKLKVALQDFAAQYKKKLHGKD